MYIDVKYVSVSSFKQNSLDELHSANSGSCQAASSDPGFRVIERRDINFKDIYCSNYMENKARWGMLDLTLINTLMSEFQTNGWCTTQPLPSVVEMPKDHPQFEKYKYLLVEGNHRTEAFKRLNLKSFTYNVLVFHETDYKATTNKLKLAVKSNIQHLAHKKASKEDVVLTLVTILNDTNGDLRASDGKIDEKAIRNFIKNVLNFSKEPAVITEIYNKVRQRLGVSDVVVLSNKEFKTELERDGDVIIESIGDDTHIFNTDDSSRSYIRVAANFVETDTTQQIIINIDDHTLQGVGDLQKARDAKIKEIKNNYLNTARAHIKDFSRNKSYIRPSDEIYNIIGFVAQTPEERADGRIWVTTEERDELNINVCKKSKAEFSEMKIVVKTKKLKNTI